MRNHRAATCLALTVAIFAGLVSPSSAAHPVPLKGTLDGTHVSRTPFDPPRVFDVFEISGTATHLGQFELTLEAIVDFGTLPPTAEGTMTFTAANGDVLVAEFTGSSALVVPGTVLITEHAIVDPENSTGRFAGATGTFTVARLADAATGVTGVTIGSFDGTITFAATP
jgi:hypothetical protein